jgi:hypothetical protein
MTDEIPRCGRPRTNGKPCGRRGGPCREHTTVEEERALLVRLEAELERYDAATAAWLGATTEGRLSFAEMEPLGRQGVPACHTWKVPNGQVPAHLSASGALRRWQADRCAICTVHDLEMVTDHDHRTGLIRGRLCHGCNTAEGVSSHPVYAAWRERPAAVLLGLEEVYWSPFSGYASPASARLGL